LRHFGQGCQMVFFHSKNSDLGKFWRTLERKMLKFLWPFGNIFQMAIKYTNIVQSKALQYMYKHQKWDFGYESIPSGNPVRDTYICSLNLVVGS
jgi:hypothetical protein